MLDNADWTDKGRSHWINQTLKFTAVPLHNKLQRSFINSAVFFFFFFYNWCVPSVSFYGMGVYWHSCDLRPQALLEEGGMVWVYVVHTGQNSLLVLPEWAAVQQSREASVWVMEDGPFLLLAEVESFFGLEYLRGVGLLGLRGGDTWYGGRWHASHAVAAGSVTTDVIISFTQNAFCNIFQTSFTAFTQMWPSLVYLHVFWHCGQNVQKLYKSMWEEGATEVKSRRSCHSPCWDAIT